MINPASRTKPIELSQIRKMFEITNPNAINLGIGEPDFNVPENIKQAMEPLYTTSSDERAGLGFAVMQSFTDKVKVRSKVGAGTTVTMEKILYRTSYDKR